MSTGAELRVRARTVRSMQFLAHYPCKRKPALMCRKHGKRPVFANDACTSRTRPKNGFLDRKLGGVKTVSDRSIVVKRDMIVSSGIMLRALYGNSSSFRTAGVDVALVAEQFKRRALRRSRVCRGGVHEACRYRRGALVSEPCSARKTPCRRRHGQRPTLPKQGPSSTPHRIRRRFQDNAALPAFVQTPAPGSPLRRQLPR